MKSLILFSPTLNKTNNNQNSSKFSENFRTNLKKLKEIKLKIEEELQSSESESKNGEVDSETQKKSNIKTSISKGKLAIKDQTIDELESDSASIDSISIKKEVNLTFDIYRMKKLSQLLKV